MKKILSFAALVIFIGLIKLVPSEPAFKSCSDIKPYNCKNKSSDGCEALRTEHCIITCIPQAGDPIDCEEILER